MRPSVTLLGEVDMIKYYDVIIAGPAVPGTN